MQTEIVEKYLNLDFLKEVFSTKISKSKSKGIDKISLYKFEENIDHHLSIIIKKVQNGTYNFTPYLENLKLKGRNKHPRIISIPTIRDKIVLYILKEILHDHFNDLVNRKLSNSYIRDIKKYLENNSCLHFHYIKLDIEKYYDTISRKILINKLRDSKLDISSISLIEKSICNITIPLNCKKHSYKNYLTEKGIPQGLSISNILAQIYLNDFDVKISKRKYFYKRYVDDILLINTDEFTNFRILNLSKEIEDLELNLNEEKTEQNILNNNPFNYLGYKIFVNKISIAEKNIEMFINRIAAKITWFKNGLNNKNKRPEYLKDDLEKFKRVFIEELNEKITGVISGKRNYGWLFYFSEINDLNLLFKLDKIIDSFFFKIEVFDNKRPMKLKKLVRTYYEIKNNKSNYIENYNNYNTIRRKRNFLANRGKISIIKNYSDEEIINIFENYKNHNLKRLESDTGYKYIAN